MVFTLLAVDGVVNVIYTADGVSVDLGFHGGLNVLPQLTLDRWIIP
jgi:hypothetical protein